MLIGRLRHRITFEKETLVDDGQGGETRSWGTRATVSASIKPLRAEERFYNEQLNHNGTHEIVIRYRDDISSTDRIKIGSGRYFQIVGIINPNERDRQLVITCKEINV